jgi:hypothetical protein
MSRTTGPRTTADAEAITRAEGRGSAALWFGLLGGPIAWSVQLVLNYALEEGIACTPASRTPGAILGLSTSFWIVVVSAVLAAITLAALTTSIAAFRRLRRDDSTPGRRAEWMAFAGIVNSVVFLLPILLAFIPALVLETCHVSL